jgi:uncharacterized SAM-binding protein YcdF (DUF218 family)
MTRVATTAGQPALTVRPRRRYARNVLLLVLALALLWVGGFVWFARYAGRFVAEEGGRTDAVVVLTGGSGRLAAGLALLAEERADKLFVSGVYRGVEVAELLALSRRAPGELECCIVLGYSAGDTAGNARETAEWIRAQGYGSLRLVTSDYHMPRSLVEFRRRLPDTEIVPHPVSSSRVHLEDWWQWPGTAILLATEYNKFLVSLLRAALGGRPA